MQLIRIPFFKILMIKNFLDFRFINNLKKSFLIQGSGVDVEFFKPFLKILIPVLINQ